MLISVSVRLKTNQDFQAKFSPAFALSVTKLPPVLQGVKIYLIVRNEVHASIIIPAALGTAAAITYANKGK